MSMSAEKRNEILQLLAAGKITAAEAAELLSATNASEPELDDFSMKEKQPEPDELDELIRVEPDPGMAHIKATGQKQPTWLRVRVKDLNTGRNKVSVNIPVRLMRFGLAVGSRFAPELQGFDWDELSDLLSSDRGLLVDVQDEEDGEHVQIYVD